MVILMKCKRSPMFKAVALFRYKMGLPLSTEPHLLSSDDVSYHARFIMEELSEFLKANEEQNIVDAADALADLVYVILGVAHHMGLPFENIFQIVHSCNMQKEPAGPEIRSKRGMKYNLIKPSHWPHPESAIRALLENRHGN